MAIQRYTAALVLTLLVFHARILAQVAETPPSSVAGDSTAATTDSVAAHRVPIGYFRELAGRSRSDRPLSQSRYTHASEALREWIGSYTYDHGIPGRREGWSIDGLPPHLSSARLNGASFDDLFTGSAQLDLLPLELLNPLKRTFFEPAPETISARVGRFYGRPPRTEIRFNQGTQKRQYISVLHSQDRSQKLFGRQGRLGVLFRYGGRGSSGAYPGSNARLRQVYARIIYEQPGWIAELSYLISRKNRGAQAGVLPRSGSGFDSIHETFSPTVRQENAKQSRDRDDLSARLRFRWLPGLPPLTVTASLTSQRDRYHTPDDTLSLSGVRTGLVVRQPLIDRGRHAVAVEARGGSTRFADSIALRDSAGGVQPYLHLSVSDSANLLGGALMLGVHGRIVDGKRTQGASAAFSKTFASGHFFLRAYSTHHHPSLLDRSGFGNAFTGAPGLSPVRIDGWSAQAETGLRQLGITFRIGGTRLANPIDYWSKVGVLERSTVPRVAVHQDSTAQQWLSASFAVDWRYRKTRGFFLRSEGTYRHFSSDGQRGNPGASLPEADAMLMLGLRYLLFKGDLDLEVAMRLRGWTAFESRTMYAPTGHFVLQEASPLQLEPAASLDLLIEGGIRTATVFLTAENLLSDLVVPGVVRVPLYPLPARAILFGVYWPLRN